MFFSEIVSSNVLRYDNDVVQFRKQLFLLINNTAMWTRPSCGHCHIHPLIMATATTKVTADAKDTAYTPTSKAFANAID